MIWDAESKRDRKITSNRPDVEVKDYERKTHILTDMSVPIDILFIVKSH